MESENPQDQKLKNIQKRLHASLDKMLLRQFGSMTPQQIIQYHRQHPEDERVDEYLIRFCSPEKQKAILEEAERLEKIIVY